MEGEALRRRRLRSSFIQDRQTFFDQRQMSMLAVLLGKRQKTAALQKLAPLKNRSAIREASWSAPALWLFHLHPPTYKWSGRNRFVGCTIDFEKRAADFGQTFLDEREVLMEAVFKDVADGSEIEIVT